MQVYRLRVLDRVFRHQCRNGLSLKLYGHAVGDLDGDPEVAHSGDLTEHAAAGYDLLSHLQGLDHLAVLFLAFLLRTNQQEVEARK